MPPESLRGRLGGSYSRPRFLMGCGLSPNQWLKSRGFTKLLRGGWFRQLLFPDPFIAEDLAKQFPSVHIAHVPDPVPENFLGDREVARRELGLATDKKVFLFYGGAYRRKGLHLAVAALRNLPASSPTFLLCAGEQPDDADTARGIAELTAQGRALSLNRYISDAEEKLVFAACDFVLLPYIKHFGSSAVLSRAMGAGKPVIASDEELVGRVVRERGLGLLFPSGDVAALGRAMEQMAGAPVTEISRWQAAARSHAQKCSRAAFRDAVVGVFA